MYLSKEKVCGQRVVLGAGGAGIEVAGVIRVK